VARRCSYLEGRRACGDVASGNPPLCRYHKEQAAAHAAHRRPHPDDESDLIIDEFIEGLVEHPKVQGVVSTVTSTIDKFAQIVDAVAAGRKPWGSSDTGPANADPAPPPNGHTRRRPGPPPPPPRRVRPADAHYLILGFVPGQRVTEAEIKERRRGLATLYHSDKAAGGGPAAQAKAEEVMKRVNAAVTELLAYTGKRAQQG
jgi:hypothetical protein